jgi:hypothetical protein
MYSLQRFELLKDRPSNRGIETLIFGIGVISEHIGHKKQFTESHVEIDDIVERGIEDRS